MTEYRGEIVRNTRVDRIEEGLDTEHAGVGGTGKSRNKFDDGIAYATETQVKSQFDTTGIALSLDQALKKTSNNF